MGYLGWWGAVRIFFPFSHGGVLTHCLASPMNISPFVEVLNYSMPQFLYLCDRNNNSIDFIGS